MELVPEHIRIGVIRGGPSSEYDISLLSGANVLEVLSETHRPVDIFISKEGVWHMGGLEKTPERILKNVDIVFNTMHGEFGEDGKIQEILSHHGVKYTGPHKYPASITNNKFLTKEHLKDLKIKTPTYFIVRQTDDLKKVSKDIFLNMIGPFIIKPVKGGSSQNIKIAKNYKELYSALYDILFLGSDALVEEYIKGKEATVSVLENYRGDSVYAFPPVEIRLEAMKPFFDYESKYSGKAEEIIPGNFSEKEKKELENLAKKIHKHLELRHYSRSDFIVTPRRGIYFLEINSLPGLTKESLLPKSLKSVGSSMKEFVHHVLNQALGR